MDSVLEELAKGFFRALAYFVLEVFFGKVCYALGWPVCKVLSFGKYPSANQSVQSEGSSKQSYWCSFAGMVVLLAVITYTLLVNT
ncbi:hypothetical protein [Rheinheimera maricola]|uniref:Uncharacterized protein n=1 Tax=Rheinheimera maricola TaxID=2793282 RepID=A0ABS7X4C1_9GAMM|nr:hypothetical protein [Rheinheimera maricola]MBZ9609975.1 hypothetical protein [Rheinheimera maricola]